MTIAKPIFLIGFMGSGKTTWGRRLAKKFIIPYIDTDLQIETEVGKPISRIFEEEGEPLFRQKEVDLLNQLTKTAAVVSTGGGLPCFANNMEVINSLGISVYLKLPPKALHNRLMLERSKRPLIAHLSNEDLLDFIETKLVEREEIYLQAKVIVNVLKADVNSLAEHLSKILASS